MYSQHSVGLPSVDSQDDLTNRVNQTDQANDTKPYVPTLLNDLENTRDFLLTQIENVQRKIVFLKQHPEYDKTNEEFRGL